MTIKILIKLNQIAQNILSYEEGSEWFNKKSLHFQKEILQQLSNMIFQSHPSHQIVMQAIKESKLKPTFTPCVLLAKNNLSTQLAKIIDLPASEYYKAYKVLISLLR